MNNQIKNIKKDTNYNTVQSYKNIIQRKENEINNLKLELQNKNNMNNKMVISEGQMMSVNFISMDQRVHFSVPCLYNNTFAEVEEKLYKRFPEYRETNNNFIANGQQVLRFKTIAQNKIGDGFPVTMVTP